MRLAQRMAYCLRKVRAIDLIGMRGRAHEYALAAAPPAAAAGSAPQPRNAPLEAS